jgi:hypothetical protein
VRADIGIANDDGGMETGAGFGWLVVSDFWLSPEQLLALDGFDRGDAGREIPVPLVVAVLVRDADKLVVVTESHVAVDVIGSFSAKLNFTSAPADWGLKMVGESLLRKSK